MVYRNKLDPNRSIKYLQTLRRLAVNTCKGSLTAISQRHCKVKHTKLYSFSKITAVQTWVHGFSLITTRPNQLPSGVWKWWYKLSEIPLLSNQRRESPLPDKKSNWKSERRYPSGRHCFHLQTCSLRPTVSPVKNHRMYRNSSYIHAIQEN